MVEVCAVNAEGSAFRLNSKGVGHGKGYHKDHEEGYDLLYGVMDGVDIGLDGVQAWPPHLDVWEGVEAIFEIGVSWQVTFVPRLGVAYGSVGQSCGVLGLTWLSHVQATHEGRGPRARLGEATSEPRLGVA
ncbi:hypothetical protein PIB30_058191 [Stylosanthes scabra]|uniref:Uncharacterized protein n=1 Tax=Stylosanthes scabra TaxID=79078 RepID=A0ABU6XLH1_9FABA|nr:hypothetical protein [Stylosanthes scabra]